MKPSLLQRANARWDGLADLALAVVPLWERATGRHSRPGRRALGSDRCVVATVASDGFTEYLLVLLHSIREHNPWFTRFPLRVFWSPQLAPLSPENQERIREGHPGTTFVSVDGAAYERYRAALLTLSPRDRQMVVARIEAQWSLAEIAERFEMRTVDGARMAVTRALRRLTDRLKK